MSEFRIAVRHVLPNTLAPLIVIATAQLGSAILTEASLSFLGLGVPEPHPSWGRMLSESAAEYVRTAPWLVIFPGARHQPRGVRHQSVRRRAARHPRPAAARLIMRMTDQRRDGARRRPSRCSRSRTCAPISTCATAWSKRSTASALRSQPRETLAIVGESGCGKSITALSLMRLVPDPPGRIAGGSVKLAGVDLLALDEEAMRARARQRHRDDLPGADDLAQSGADHRQPDRRGRAAAREASPRSRPGHKAVDMLRLTRIPEPEQRAKEYPHQLSGGMRQRAMIAMALACNPKVLIADEPTTALDVTIQAQILDIILDLQRKLGTAVILITHDLGVVAETAQRVIVMYAGRKVEEAPVEELFARPQHPYTHGLMASIPRLPSMRGEQAETAERLQEILSLYSIDAQTYPRFAKCSQSVLTSPSVFVPATKLPPCASKMSGRIETVSPDGS